MQNAHATKRTKFTNSGHEQISAGTARQPVPLRTRYTNHLDPCEICTKRPTHYPDRTSARTGARAATAGSRRRGNCARGFTTRRPTGVVYRYIGRAAAAGRPDRHDTRPHYRTVAFPPSMTDERRSRMVAEINCLVCDHNRQHAASRRSAAAAGSGSGGREPRGSVSDRNESKPVVDVAAAASKSIVSPVNQ